MNSLYLIFLLVAAATAAITEHRITKQLTVPKGTTVELLSPDYPKIPAAGTAMTWYLTGDAGSNILLTCDDIMVGPSKLCRDGWFKVHDGSKAVKYCEKKTELSVKSVSNEMTVQIDLVKTVGRSRCKATGV
uniref:Venom CUB domain protein 3 n=1 Tax=Platymeris rhadamanthus TaxID=1134088 RepID=A0A6B9L1D2_PLARH|nr:venom CUB domain protein 3 [Platymeris rhadamanthus]